MAATMKMGVPYTLGRARSSLIHFGLGKVAAALTGLVLLLVLVRALAPRDYGAYVALLAFLEIFYLLTGWGLSTIAQRYVAEYRVKASPGRFRTFILRLLALRLALALGFVALIAGVALAGLEQGWIAREGPVAALGGPLLGGTVALLVAGVMVRFLDELFAALLMQGATQGLLFLRNAVRLAALVALMGGGPVALHALVLLEALVQFGSVVLGAGLLAGHLHSNAVSGGDPHYANPRLASVSLRFFLVQALGQLYGADILKLLTTRLLGVTQTAVFGFAQAFADIIRSYLPAYLLTGWIRPLLVARYVERRDTAELAWLAGLALKLNLFVLAPVAVFFALDGRAFAALLSGGRYGDAGAMLFWLVLLVAVQSVHLVLGLVAVTLERAGANIVATLLAGLALPFALVLAPRFGLPGVAWSLIGGELLWCATVALSLARHGLLPLQMLVGGWLRLLVATGAAYLLTTALLPGPAVGGWALLGHGLLAGASFLTLAAGLKPFTGRERDVLGKVLPLRWWFW